MVTAPVAATAAAAAATVDTQQRPSDTECGFGAIC